jgi:hypothetical protein
LTAVPRRKAQERVVAQSGFKKGLIGTERAGIAQ